MTALPPPDEIARYLAALDGREYEEALELLAALGAADCSALTTALDKAAAARELIGPEQERLRDLARHTEDDVLRDYLEYQADLVEWQLTAAAKAAEARIRHIAALDTPEARAAENAKCEADTVYWFKWWAWGMDPRSPLPLQPFVPFDFQEQSIRWTDDLVFTRRMSGVIEKSRDMGLTWEKTNWSVKHWLYRSHFAVLFGSMVQDKVDSKKGESDTIFEKIRIQLRLLPDWMLPEGFDMRQHVSYMHVENPANGAILVGEAPTPNFGRSGRYSTILLDELAFWPGGGRLQWTSCSQSSKSKIVFSSIQGKRTKQYELRQMKNMPVLTLHWRLHPWKDDRWYAAQPLEMKPHEIRQELDIDYTASLAGQLLAEYDETVHVITRSEFQQMFGDAARDEDGRFRLPARGYIGCAQDVGTTIDHPCATSYVWRPHETMPFSDSVFFYRELVFPEWPEPSGEPVSVGRVARAMYDAEMPWGERPRCKTRLMSHEAASERATYQYDIDPRHRVAWVACESGARSGLAQIQNYMHIDRSRSHPCRKYPVGYTDATGRDLGGEPIKGRSRFYIVVADGEGEIEAHEGRLIVRDPQTVAGMPRMRAEIPAYHLPTDAAGDEKKEVKPLFNDIVDTIRMLGVGFFPAIEKRTAYEQAIAEMDERGTLETQESIIEYDDLARGVAILAHMQDLEATMTKVQRAGTIYNPRLRSPER